MPSINPNPGGFIFSVIKDTTTPPGIPSSILPLVVIGYVSNTAGLAVNKPTPFSTPGAVLAAGVSGPAVEHAAGALDSNGGVKLVHVVNVETTTPGAYGSITQDWADASPPIVAADSVVLPEDDLDVVVLFTAGGDLGTTGIKYRLSLDGGLHYFAERALGIATTITAPNGGGKYLLNPPASSLVALAVEIRADLLAHFADGTAHNSADATAAALISLGAPATNAASLLVINQCRLAVISHLQNATAHDSVDVAHALTLGAATTQQEALLLAIQIRDFVNLHLLATAAAAPAGLLVATATVAAPVTVLAAAMIAGGVSSLDDYPRAITFTTAGATPSDAPATVDIAGFDVAGVAQTETGLVLSQIAGAVTSTKKWRGAGLSVTYAAADGTGATIAIGLTAAAHNSADVTNTITGADPATGTITAADTFSLSTSAPAPDATQLAAAFASLRTYGGDAGTIAISGPIPGSYVSTIEAELIELWKVGKFYNVVASWRRPTLVETAAQYSAAIDADMNGIVLVDLRLCTGAVYHESALINTADGRATPRRPNGWWVSMAAARNEPQNYLGFITPQRGVKIADSRGNVLPGCLDELSGSLYSVQNRTIGTRRDLLRDAAGGVFVTQDLVLYDDNSDWILGPYSADVNYALRVVSPVIVKASTVPGGFPSSPVGPLDDEVVKSLEATAQSFLDEALVDAGRVSAATVAITDSSAAELKYKVSIVPNYYPINGLEITATVVSREV